jgi:hypothetical protein
MKFESAFPRTRAEDLYRNFGFIVECVVDVAEGLLLDQGAISSKAIPDLARAACGRGAKLWRAI